MDIGIRKTFFNKKLAVAFNVRDLFGSRHWENYTESDTFWRHQKNWRKGNFNLQVTWNFGNMNNEKKGYGREELIPSDNDGRGTRDNQPAGNGEPQPDNGNTGGSDE